MVHKNPKINQVHLSSFLSLLVYLFLLCFYIYNLLHVMRLIGLRFGVGSKSYFKLVIHCRTSVLLKIIQFHCSICLTLEFFYPYSFQSVKVNQLFFYWLFSLVSAFQPLISVLGLGKVRLGTTTCINFLQFMFSPLQECLYAI